MNTKVDKDLLLEFFLVFSRFEYCLKATGMFVRHAVEPPKWPRAEPDWDSFANQIRDSFDRNATDELREACLYIVESPPNQQVFTGHELAWETPCCPKGESEIAFLLRMVRSVRNNLFHGGKYNIDFHEDTDRTTMLLRSSLHILNACLNISPNQLAAYHEARL